MMRLALGLLVLMVGTAWAGDDPEIEFLLTAVGQSDCTFIRNDKPHSAEKAADHLRMKYRRGRWAVDNAEEFIIRIASKSTMSGNPYRVQCAQDEPELTSDWLTDRLARYRAAEASEPQALSQSR
jgi:hypothetical protein